MKKGFKWLAGILLSAMLVLILVPGKSERVYAAGIDAPATAEFMFMGEYGYSEGAIRVKNVTDKEYVDVTSIQSTDTNIVEPSRVQTMIRKKADKSYSDVFLRINGIGTAQVTYTIGKQKYSTEVTITPYENLIRSITFTNVNGGADFSDRTKESAYPAADRTYTDEGIEIDNRLILSQTTDQPILALTTLDGWDIYSANLSNYNRKTKGVRDDNYYQVTEEDKDPEMITSYNFTFTQIEKLSDEWESNSLHIQLNNPATKQTVSISYQIY